MKNIKTVLFLLVVFILTAESCAQKTAEVEGIPLPLLDSASYVMGVNIGKSMVSAQMQTLNADTIINEMARIFNGQTATFDRATVQQIIQGHMMHLMLVGQNEEAVKGIMDSMTVAQKDSLAIACGVNFGDNLKNTGLGILNTAVMSEAIKAAMAEDSLRYDDATMQSVMRNFMAKRTEYAGKKAIQNKEDGKKFLQKNKKADGVMELPSGMQYKVIIEGTGAKPTATDNVRVHYRGTFIDTTRVFDSSYDRGEPVEFPLQGVIKGWTEGLQYMSEGAKYMFYIPSDLAYGDEGRPGIDGGSLLIFEVELLEVLPAEAQPVQPTQQGE